MVPPPPTATSLPEPPAALVRAGASGRLLVIVGVGAPRWHDLLAETLRAAIAQTDNDAEKAALLELSEEWQASLDGGWDVSSKKQALIDVLGEPRFRYLFASSARMEAQPPKAIHFALAQLHPNAVFINLSWDGRLEQAFESVLGRKLTIQSLQDIEQSNEKPDLLSLYGDQRFPKHLIFPDDPGNGIWRQFASAYESVLLVGFGKKEGASALHSLWCQKGWYWLVEKGPRQAVQAKIRGLLPIWVDKEEQAARVLDGLRDAIKHFKIVRDVVDPSYRRLVAWSQYREGKLSFEALCAESGQSAAFWVEQIFDEMETNPGPMSPPLRVGAKEPESVTGLHFVMSELELLLLEKLGQLRTLLDAVGPKGRILIFKDVLDPIMGSPGWANPAIELSGVLPLSIMLRETLRLGLQNGIVEAITRPTVDDLPKLKDFSGIDETTRAKLETRRVAWQKSLAYLDALTGHPERRLLSADYFVTAVIGTYPDLTLSLEFSAESFGALTQRFRAAHGNWLPLPSLIRLLPPREQRLSLLTMLAGLGFADAMKHEELLELADNPEGLDNDKVKAALDGASRIALEPEHPGTEEAQIQLVYVYSSAIWNAYVERDKFEPAEREALMGRLLARAEQIDNKCASNVLDRLLMLLLECARAQPRSSLVPNPESAGTLITSEESNAGQIWRDHARWAGEDGRRHAAFARAARYACLILDEETAPSGPTRKDFAPLSLAAGTAIQRGRWDVLPVTVGILSAQWQNNALLDDAYSLNLDGDPTEHVSFDALFSAAVKFAEADPNNIRMLDSELRFPYPLAGSTAPATVHVPVEGWLLRLSDSTMPHFAKQLSLRQGPLDGRAHKRLKRLQDTPSDQDARRAYARMTVMAPWRLVREEPTSIRTWRKENPAAGAFPTSLEDLREILSEPKEPLPERGSLIELLMKRIDKGNCWAERSDRALLLRLSCEIPGTTPFMPTPFRFTRTDDLYHHEAQIALHQLRHANDFSTGQVCSAIYFLRYAAAHRPFIKTEAREIDLREELPTVLATMLQQTKTRPPGSMAEVEPALLRLCGKVVGRLAFAEHVPTRSGIWLSHRLMRWLWAQLEALLPNERVAGLSALEKIAPPPQVIPGDDLMHPRRVDRDRFDYRLASVLLALLSMDHFAKRYPPSEGPKELRNVSSPTIEAILVDRACQKLTDEELDLRRVDLETLALDWWGPIAVPDLALSALLQLNVERLSDIPHEIRLRWLEDIPRKPEKRPPLTREFALGLWAACAHVASKLSDEEKSYLENLAREPDTFEKTDAPKARWQMLTALFFANRPHLEAEVLDLLNQHLGDSEAPSAFSKVIAGFSRHAPERIEATAKSILEAAIAKGIDPIPLAMSLEAAMMRGRRVAIPTIRGVLVDCADRPPYNTDPRFTMFLSAIGLSRRS